MFGMSVGGVLLVVFFYDDCFNEDWFMNMMDYEVDKMLFDGFGFVLCFEVFDEDFFMDCDDFEDVIDDEDWVVVGVVVF